MNNIHRIDGLRSLSAISQQRKNDAVKPEQATVRNETKDEVQISDKALYMSKIASLPEIRSEKVESVKEALANGSYDVEGKLSEALDRFLDEYML